MFNAAAMKQALMNKRHQAKGHDAPVDDVKHPDTGSDEKKMDSDRAPDLKHAPVSQPIHGQQMSGEHSVLPTEAAGHGLGPEHLEHLAALLSMHGGGGNFAEKTNASVKDKMAMIKQGKC